MRISNRSPFQRKGRTAYKVENKADETTVYIYDEISWYGVDAQAFVKDFNKITSGTINLRVNSPGGSVFDGTTIFNAIQQHPSKTIAHVDGLAASIASVIVMAADEVIMAENAFLMIHNPWSMVAGDADDFRKEADLLDKVQGTIAKTYMDKSGKEEKEVLAMMTDETWMTAQEAFDEGFVDAIGVGSKEKASATTFDLSIFDKVPDKLKKTDEDLTAREVERILRDAGCSNKQAKGIVSEGFEAEQRDVVAEDKSDLTAEEVQRDVVAETDGVEVLTDEQRDVAAPEEFGIEDPTAALLARAERIAPTACPEDAT